MLMILYNLSGALVGAELDPCDSWPLLLIGYRWHYAYFLIWLQSIQLAIKNSSLVTLYGNFARGFVWVWNLVADIEGGTQAEGVWE